MKKACGIALLAGGSGKRMGHVNKAELVYRNRTFAEHLYEMMQKSGMPGYVSVGRYEQSVPENFTVVPDIPDITNGVPAGPMGGIYACLTRAEADGLDGLIFCPCDAPLFSGRVIEKLADITKDDVDAVVFKTEDGRLQTTFGYYAVSGLPVMRRDLERGKSKLIRYLQEVNCRIVSAADCGLEDHLFMNVNTMEDYRKLQTL